MKKLVILDFDGTLADTRELIIRTNEEAMRRRLCRLSFPRCGKRWRRCLRRVRTMSSTRLPNYCRWFSVGRPNPGWRTIPAV